MPHVKLRGKVGLTRLGLAGWLEHSPLPSLQMGGRQLQLSLHRFPDLPQPYVLAGSDHPAESLGALPDRSRPEQQLSVLPLLQF